MCIYMYVCVCVCVCVCIHQCVQLKIKFFFYLPCSEHMSQSSQEKVCNKGFWKYSYLPNKIDLAILFFAASALLLPRMQI